MELLFRMKNIRILLVDFLIFSLIRLGRFLPLGGLLSLGWLVLLPAAGLPCFEVVSGEEEITDSAMAASAICPLIGGGCDNKRTEILESETSFENTVFRVVHSYRLDNGMRYADKGSGVLIQNEEQESFVLTAAHIFNGRPGKITAANRSGFETEGTLRLIDRNWDIALLELKDTPSCGGVDFAQQVPEVGDSSRIAGFGPDNRLLVTRGETVGYTQTQKTSSYETLKTTGAVRQGDSGGPVFNDSGELVGIVWGTDGSCSYATYFPRIQRILAGKKELGFAIEKEQLKQKNNENDDKKSDKLPDQQENVNGGKHRIFVPQRENKDGGKSNRLLEKDGDAAERIVGWVLKSALPAMGVAVPSSVLTVYTCWRVLHRVRKLRKKVKNKKKSQNHSENKEKKETVTLVNSHNDYAQELNDLYDLNGRNSVADATLGRLYDTELARAEESSDEMMARFAQKLRQKMKKELCRIHSEVPVPISENEAND